MNLNTIKDCDLELDRIRAELEPLRVFPDQNRDRMRRLNLERGRALKRRIELQHADLFAKMK